MSTTPFRRPVRRATTLATAALLGAACLGGIAHAGTVGSGYDTSNGTGTIGPAAPGDAITRAQITARAQDWMNAQVPYSQSEGWQDSGTGGPYRMDCSGFVSMAWGLPTSMVTWTLPDVANVTSSNISGDKNINPGDALDYTQDHVVLFDHWTDSSGDFAYDAEHTTGQVANQSTGSVYNSTLEGYAISDFEALQYNNLAAGGGGTAAPAAPSISITTPGGTAGGTPEGSGNITISGSAGDSTSGASFSTQLYVDGAAVGSPVTGASPVFSWNSTALGDGVHSITAKTTASTSGGSASTTSAALSIMVYNESGTASVHALGSGVNTVDSVFTVDKSTGDLQESWIPQVGAAWATHNLTTLYGTPAVRSGTVPVAVVHQGWTSVFTVDAANGDLQETYLSAFGQPWGTHDLTALYGTPAIAPGTSPAASYHQGWTSVFTVDAANNHLQETYLSEIGQSWGTHDLSSLYGTPALAAGTTPAALYHGGYLSVYTNDASSNHLQESYVAAIGQPWLSKDLSAQFGTPAMRATSSPSALVHDGWSSVFTVNGSNGDLQETYLSQIGQPWGSHDLSSLYGTPAIAAGSNPAPVFHDGYTSVLTADASNSHLQETYLAAIGDPWTSKDLSTLFSAPALETGTSPVALYHTGYTSIYTLDSAGDLNETFIGKIGDPWTSKNLSTIDGTPVADGL